jgi:hypothetical protein
VGCSRSESRADLGRIGQRRSGLGGQQFGLEVDVGLLERRHREVQMAEFHACDCVEVV